MFFYVHSVYYRPSEQINHEEKLGEKRGRFNADMH